MSGIWRGIEASFIFGHRDLPEIAGESSASNYIKPVQRCPSNGSDKSDSIESGGMAEWFKAAVLKTVDGESCPGVRIPLPPPDYLAVRLNASLANCSAA